MNWYLTKLVFRIISGNGDHRAQFDEQLRLVTASDEKEAYHKACLLGKREEDTFINRKKQWVQWSFINVCEVKHLVDLSDGAELYSRIEEKDYAEAFIQIVNKKAEKWKKEEKHPYSFNL